MKKTILLSFIVTSLVIGANTVDNLTIDQKSEITSSSTIDNATVHQGKTDVLGASDVDTVTIKQNGDDNGNLIQDSVISGKYTNDISVLQGTVKVEGSSIASDLYLESQNRISKVELLNSIIEQGSFTMTDANATDSDTSGVEFKSANIVEKTSVDDGVDVNATEVKQAIVMLSSATTDNLELEYLNKVIGSTVESTQVHQGMLTVEEAVVDTLSVGGTGGLSTNINTIENSSIEGGSVLQSSIHVYNHAHVQGLTSKLTNLISGTSTLTNSTISQSETTIH